MVVKNASKNKNKKNNKYKKTKKNKLKRTKVMYGGQKMAAKVKKTFESAPNPTKFRAKGSISATGAQGKIGIPGVGTFGAKVNLSKLGGPGALTVTQKKPSMFSWSKSKKVNLSTATNLVGKTLSSASSKVKELSPEASNFLGNKPGFFRKMVEKGVRLGSNAAKYSEELYAKAREGAPSSGFDSGQGTKRFFSAAELGTPLRSRYETDIAKKFGQLQQGIKGKMLAEANPDLHKVLEETGIKLDPITELKFAVAPTSQIKLEIMTKFLAKDTSFALVSAQDPEKTEKILAELEKIKTETVSPELGGPKNIMGLNEKIEEIGPGGVKTSFTTSSSSTLPKIPPGAQSAMSSMLGSSGFKIPSKVPSLSAAQMSSMASMASKFAAFR